MKLITNVQELEKILKELKANPIFYAFGENKENFHSSFWKWMFNENAKETILILTGINENEDLNLNNSFLEREQNASNSDKEHKYKARYDVLITINGIRKYIIETKVKSFPTLEQLRRIEYATKDKHKIKFFCIHLYPSNTLENLKSTLNNWFFYDFESLSKRINIEKFSQIKRVYIEDYKKMLIGLSDLFRLFSFNQTRPNYDFVWKNAKNQEDNFDLQAKLEEYKLWELFLHYRSKHFFYSLQKAINESEEISDKMKKLLVYESSINNKKSTISIGYILQGDSDLVNYSLNEIDRRINKSNQSDTKIVGIQIEDEQFRQFVLSKKDSEKLFQNMEKQGFFENCHDLQKDKLFCKYGDTFKYRYTKLQISDFDGILYQVVQYFNKVERLESNLLQI